MGKQVVIEIAPGHVDVVAFDGGRRLRGQRLTVLVESDPIQWAKVLRHNIPALRMAVEAMKLTGWHATLLYRSPSQTVDLSSFELRSAAQVLEAARLNTLGSMPATPFGFTCEAAIIARDSAGENRQSHVIVAAEREDVSQTLIQFVEESGLKCDSITPLDAALMSFAVGKALVHKGPPCSWLYVGEQTTFFVIAGNGKLMFSRRINIGVAAMAAALLRPISMSGREQPVKLSHEESRTILHRFGIPDRDQVVHEAHGLTGQQIVPPLQTVLQRFVVELRQSLRYGLSEEDRLAAADGELTINFTGPGASVPGLAELLTQELALQTTADARYAGYDCSNPGSDASEMADARGLGHVLQQVNLLPEQVASRRGINRIRRWLWAGTAAALILLSADGLSIQKRLTEARHQAKALVSNLAAFDALRAKQDQLEITLKAMSDLETTIDKAIGSNVDYRSFVLELNRLRPHSVQFTNVNFHRTNDKTTGLVNGYAFVGSADSAQTELGLFIEQMGRSPLFAQVALKNVRKDSGKGGESQQFEMTFSVVTVPRQAVVATQTAAVTPPLKEAP